MWLVACAPQSAATASPERAATNTPPPTATIEPTPTAIPTPIPVIGVDTLALGVCPKIVDANVTDKGMLQIIYTDGDNRLERWREDSQRAIPIPLPSGALTASLLIDERGIVYRHDFGDSLNELLIDNPNDRYLSHAEKSELWMVDAEGQNERRLATVSFDEIKHRHPRAEYATLEYRWIPHADKIYYSIEINGPMLGSLRPTYDTFALVDIHSGKSISLVQPGEASNVAIAPDGSQAAVLTGDTLRLINIENGDLQFTIASPIRNDLSGIGFRNLAYSPNSNYVIGFSDEGIASVNTKNGESQSIPLEYTILRGSAPASPKFTWINNTTIVVPVTNLSEGVREIIKPSDYPRGAAVNFTVWRVNLLDAIAEPVSTFKGSGPSALFSPDGALIVFDGRGQYGASQNGKFVRLQQSRNMLAGPPPNLVLANLNTGKILTVMNVTNFLGWSSNSELYIYSQPVDLDHGLFPILLYLGQVGKDPILVRQVEQPLGYRWVDEDRFVIKDGCQILDVKVLP